MWRLECAQSLVSLSARKYWQNPYARVNPVQTNTTCPNVTYIPGAVYFIKFPEIFANLPGLTESNRLFYDLVFFLFYHLF